MKCLCLALLAGCAVTEPGGPALAESEWVAAITACPTGQWCVESPPSIAASALLHAVWAASAEDVFAVGNNGTILRRNNDAWTAMTSGTSANLRGVWGTSSSDVWAGGVGGALVHFDGTEWSPVSGATTDIDSVWASSPSDAWFVGSGTVLHWTGTQFTRQGFGGILLSVSGNGPNDVWVTGESTNVHRWNGSVWSPLNAGVGTSSLMTVLAVAVNDVWISDFMPGKETSHWNGTKWTPFRASSTDFNGMSALASNDIWGVYSNKVGHWDGTSWTVTQPFGASASMWSVTTRPGNAWVVGDSGLIAHRSF
jgi:hypothetical protein